MSSLKRGRDMDNQAWYAVLRHRRGNPDTRFAVTYPYCCTLSTLPADGTLALEPRRGTRTTSAAGGTSPLAGEHQKEEYSGMESKRGVSRAGVPPFGGIGRSIVRSGFRRTWVCLSSLMS